MGAPAFRARGLRIRSQGPRMDRIRLPLRRVGTPAALRVPAPGRVATMRWRFIWQRALGTGLTSSTGCIRKDHDVPRIRAISAARRGRCANAHERHSAYTYTGTKVPCQGVNDELQEGPNGTVAKMTTDGAWTQWRGHTGLPASPSVGSWPRAGFASRDSCADRAGPVSPSPDSPPVRVILDSSTRPTGPTGIRRGRVTAGPQSVVTRRTTLVPGVDVRYPGLLRAEPPEGHEKRGDSPPSTPGTARTRRSG
jgi:hypothetical protein